MPFDFGFVTSTIGLVLSPVVDLLKGWQERRKIALENEVALARAKTDAMIKMMETKQTADIAWENLSITNSGWKDEDWTLVLSIPAIMCFFPGLAEYVRAGFEALSTCPEWYQWALGIAVGSAFGIRKFAEFMNFKKGS